jgi:hypothetical protein
MIKLNGEKIEWNGLDVSNLPERFTRLTIPATVNGHGVATEIINPSDELSTPAKRDSFIVGTIEIDGMGQILLRDVTIKYRVFHRSVASFS